MTNRFNYGAVSVFIGVLCWTNCLASDLADPANDAPSPSATAGALKPDSTAFGNPDLLPRIQAANEDLYTALQSFVCQEEIQRFKSRLNGDNVRPIDTLSAKLSFENGTEQYTDIRQNTRQLASISNVGGAWSIGEYGTLLRQTQMLLDTHPPVFRMYADFEGSSAAMYQLEVSEQDSPWDLLVRSEHFRIAFRTQIWVSLATGQILKIERSSLSVPPQMGISEIRWGVTLKPVELNGRTWLLPQTGDYEVLYVQSGRREFNVMTFSAYRRYGSEVALRFQ